MRNSSGATLLTGLLTGVAVGVSLGLLYAPKSGAETRRMLAGQATELKYRAGDLGEGIIDRAGDFGCMIRERVKEAGLMFAGDGSRKPAADEEQRQSI